MTYPTAYAERLLAKARETSDAGDVRAAADNLHAEAARALRELNGDEALEACYAVAVVLRDLDADFPGLVPPPRYAP